MRVLDLQSNRIRSMEGLESLSSLEELYLAYNGITEIVGLDQLVRMNDDVDHRRP